MDRTDMMHRMYDIKGPLVAKKFAARGFEAVYCPTKEEALKRLIFEKPNQQLCFTNQRAIDCCISFIDSKEL